MKITEEQLQEIKECLDKLNSCFNDKIKELHDVKGGQSERHAFTYYRSLSWDIERIIRNLKTK